MQDPRGEPLTQHGAAKTSSQMGVRVLGNEAGTVFQAKGTRMWRSARRWQGLFWDRGDPARGAGSSVRLWWPEVCCVPRLHTLAWHRLPLFWGVLGACTG